MATAPDPDTEDTFHSPLKDPQATGLRARFPHFEELRSDAAQAFHEEQPEHGVYSRKGVEFPCVVMQNGVRWYHDRERRPVDDEGHPVKSESPKGRRNLLAVGLDDPGREEVILVEGEGHLVALLSLGFRGVAVAGGVAAFTSNRANGRATRERFRGKSVRILFDPDEAGRKAAPAVARALIASGATRVAMVFPPVEGVDVEDWLADFETAEGAKVALQELLASADWEGAEAGREEGDGRPVPLQAERFHRPEGDPVLAVMVYDDFRRQEQIAVFGPEATPQDGAKPFDSVNHDEGPASHVWSLLDEWAFEGVTYVPDLTGSTQQLLDQRMLILPPPPYTGEDTSEALWDDLKSFYSRYFACESIYYDALAAYCFLTWRHRDAGFDNCPLFQFVGTPGSGKNRGLDVMRHTCFRTYATKPAASNLHRVVEFFGDFTLVIDEFHLDRGKTDAEIKQLIDLLNQSFTRGTGSLVKMDGGNGGRLEPGIYPVYGPKIFASYTAADDDKGAARRTLVIPTGVVEPPAEMQTPQFPPEAIEEARFLRARLLAWRARNLRHGLPDIRGERWRRTSEVAGINLGQAFWPLVEMVPEGRPEAMENLLAIAEVRKKVVDRSEALTPAAHLASIAAEALAEWQDRENPDDAAACKMRPVRTRSGGLLVPTLLLREKADPNYYFTEGRIVRELVNAGFPHRQSQKIPCGGETAYVSGFLLRGSADKDGEKINRQVEKAMKALSLTWPPIPSPKRKEAL